MNKKIMIWFLGIILFSSCVFAAEYYNLNNLTNTTNFYEVSRTMNDFSGGVLFAGILLFSYLLSFAISLPQGTRVSFLVAGFVSTVLAIGLVMLHLIAVWLMVIVFVMFIASIAVYVFMKN